MSHTILASSDPIQPVTSLRSYTKTCNITKLPIAKYLITPLLASATNKVSNYIAIVIVTG